MPVAVGSRLSLAQVISSDPVVVRPQGSATELDAYANYAGPLTVGQQVLTGFDEAGRLVVFAQTTNPDYIPNTADAVTSLNIADAAITRDHILADAIDRTKIAQGEVTAALIAVDAINGETHIQNDSITSPLIAANAILGYHIVANSISASHIAAYSITAQEIAAEAITADRILARTITADRIATGAITTNEIQANTITAGDIEAGTLTSASGVFGAISANDITTGSLSADRISGGTITAGTIILNGAVLQSNNYNGDFAGADGWSMNNGNAVFNDVTIRGTLDGVGGTFTGTLSASQITSGTMSAARINGGEINGVSMNIGSGTFTVSSGGAMTATSATVTGAITATSGTFTGTVSMSGSGKLVTATSGARLEITASGADTITYYDNSARTAIVGFNGAPGNGWYVQGPDYASRGASGWPGFRWINGSGTLVLGHISGSGISSSVLEIPANAANPQRGFGTWYFGRVSGDPANGTGFHIWNDATTTLDLHRDGTNAGTRLIRGTSDIGGANSTVIQVFADGDVYNTNNTYGVISDPRFKAEVQRADRRDISDVEVIRYRSSITDKSLVGYDADAMVTGPFGDLVKNIGEFEGEQDVLAVNTVGMIPYLHMELNALREEVDRLSTELAALGGV